MPSSLPLPVLHIQRVESSCYNWALSMAGQLFEQEDGLLSIEGCLRQAFLNLSENDAAVEIRYRGIGLGSFSVKILQQAPDVLADKLVERFSEVMDCIA